VKSIFGRKKPLAEATLRRTARGVMRYVVDAAKPFIVPITHTKGSNAARTVDDPLCTITTAKGGENMVAVPHIAKFRTGATGSDIEEPLLTFTANSFEKRPGGAVPLGLVGATIVGAGGRAAQSAPRDMAEPLGTTTGKEDRLLVAATLVDTAHGEGMGRGVSEWSLEDALRTVGASGGKAVVAASLVSLAHGDSASGGNNREHDLADPVKTIHAGGGNAALVAAFLAQHNTGEPGRSAEDPVSTIVTLGSTQGVVAATLGNLHGTNQDGRPIEEPLSTIAAGGSHAHLILGFLQHYFGSGKQDDDVRQPLGAFTGKARYGLVEVMVKGVRHYIDDIGIRMLEPEEGAAAHGFKNGALPAEITIDGKTRRLTKTEKYHLVGNSVPPRMIELLAECNVRHAFAEAAE